MSLKDIDTLNKNPVKYANKLEINDLEKLLRKFSDKYYNTGEPLVSDYVFDELRNIGVNLAKLKYNQGFRYNQSLHWITDLGNLSKGVTEVIKELGYDGVIYGSEYVVFKPNYVKSVENDGSWDIDDNDIYS